MTVIHAKQMLTPEGWAQNRAVHIGLDGRIAAVTAQGGACDSYGGFAFACGGELAQPRVSAGDGRPDRNARA